MKLFSGDCCFFHLLMLHLSRMEKQGIFQQFGLNEDQSETIAVLRGQRPGKTTSNEVYVGITSDQFTDRNLNSSFRERRFTRLGYVNRSYLSAPLSFC
jgi:hypothetical protein